MKMEESDFMLRNCTIIGELSSLVLMIGPLKSFIFCGKSNQQKLELLKTISYNYLITLLLMSTAWLAYSYKINNFDLILINWCSTVSSVLYIVLYLYIRTFEAFPYKEFFMFIFSIPFQGLLFTDFLSLEAVGFLATVLNTIQYLSILDNIKEILESRSRKEINLFVTNTSGFNSVAWLGFGVLTNDIYIFIPCAVGTVTFCVQIVLYLWTIRRLSDHCLMIILLKRIIDRVQGETLEQTMRKG